MDKNKTLSFDLKEMDVIRLAAYQAGYVQGWEDCRGHMAARVYDQGMRSLGTLPDTLPGHLKSAKMLLKGKGK